MDRVVALPGRYCADAAPTGLSIAEVNVPAWNKLRRHADCLTVLCPLTKSSIPTRIGTDVRTLAKAWHTKIKVSCPHCREVHVFRVCEAFVEWPAPGSEDTELGVILEPEVVYGTQTLCKRVHA